MATTIVLVFDFDKTIIDCDSDNWVIDHLGATKFFDHLLLSLPWNIAMVSFYLSIYLYVYINVKCIYIYIYICLRFAPLTSWSLK